MRIETFEMERMQSTWENVVDYDMSESGVLPLTLRELVEMGFDRALVERVERMVATSEFKRQVPPVAKLGPRTAGVDYLYPRRRPGSARS